MTRVQLAMLIGWLEPLQSRKRLQKVAFLLQAAGWPGNLDFELHSHGPYSLELSRLCEELVQSGLVREEPVAGTAGRQYAYSLSELGRLRLNSFEASSQPTVAALARYEGLARRLSTVDLPTLEIASTMVYLRLQVDWTQAVLKASRLQQPGGDPVLLSRAEELARQLMP